MRNGQAMIIATVALGGAFLGVTTIAGLLMLYQIQATTDLTSSAKAIFAADAGVESALFDFYCQLTPTPRCTPPPTPPLPGSPPGTLGNGSTVSVTCYDVSGTTAVSCDNTATAVSAISKGLFQTSKRAFFVDLASAQGAFP